MGVVRQLLSLDNVPLQDIDSVLTKAAAIRRGQYDVSRSMTGRILCPVFFQDSSRTFINSASSFTRMGGTVLPLNVANTRIGSAWSEPIRDFCTLLNATCDAAIVRVPSAYAIFEFAQYLSIPFINAGNGIGSASEHPMQALIDLFTIRESAGRRPVRILMIGGIHIRTTRTQFKLFRRAGYDVDIIAPPFSVRNEDMTEIFAAARHLDDVRDTDLSLYDVIYHNGMDEDPNVATNTKFNLNKDLLVQRGFKGWVMHSLPRLTELSSDIDDSPFNLYYTQMELSKFVFQSCFDYIIHGGAVGFETKQSESSHEFELHT